MSSTERVFKNRVSNKLDLQTQFDKANSNKANNLNLLATLAIKTVTLSFNALDVTLTPLVLLSLTGDILSP